MKITVAAPNFQKAGGKTLVIGVWEGPKVSDSKALKFADTITDGVVARTLSKNKKFGKLFESLVFHIAPKKHANLEKVILFGLGKPQKLENYFLKQAAGAIAKITKKDESVSLYFPNELSSEHKVGLIINGYVLGLFDSGHQKSEKNGESKTKLAEIELLADGDLAKLKKSADNGLAFGQATNKVRETVNLPANIATPEYMVAFAKKLARENKLAIEVFSEKQVNDMGMGIMASVAKGSDEDLYFVIMKYSVPGTKKTLALVGKGITFDSGGISIKPSESMEWMKMDMAGAAAVFGAMEIISKVKPRINVVAAVPLTENLPSGRATKPGDVVKGLLGKTVEVINTDAEGRLVLADAITYVQKKFKADYIVDVATLTGAAVVVLGSQAAAILGRPKKFVDELISAGEQAGERYWPLPLYDEYREQLKSYIADIANVSSTRGAGTSSGAKFLEDFVDAKVNWAHLDIAPNAWEESEKPYAAKGATGVAVSTLVQLAVDLAKK